MKAGFLDAIDFFEQIQPARGQNLASIARIAIRVDQFASGQCRNDRRQFRGRHQRGEVDVMHLVQIGHGINGMFRHQPGQRRAVLAPVIPSQPVRVLGLDPQQTHHIAGHAGLDLGKQRHFGRIERIVQIEDPGIDI